ncbi:hypothetical protein GBA65_18845 [Rubrobacter marinus]|uniref:Uncharacterized protein n=1 Tax=Rubrobacter marinus TaxID=2653852 RepID=A0A6G8Q1N5_9ACTN|nr:hypothetical protein [Rubrobacter marinus]QIN80237.1 hypothetical protein GBA65_18845 [Rubrobacter marinus]
MSREAIERAMEEAGWKLDAGFVDHLVVGHDSVVSILAYPWSWKTDAPAFEISHEVKDTTYWVREIPTPQRAIELIEENGGPAGEERGNPHKAESADEGMRSS